MRKFSKAFGFFLLFLSSSSAQAFMSSKDAYQMEPPPGWQIGDPQRGCNQNSFCFVMNPDEADVVFLQPYDAAKLKDPNQTLIQNLLNTIIIKGPSNAEELKALVKKTFEGLMKIADGGFLKDFKVLKYDGYQYKNMKGELFYWQGMWGKHLVDVMQLYVSGPANTLLLSCSYNPEESKKYEKLCMESFKTLKFQ